MLVEWGEIYVLMRLLLQRDISGRMILLIFLSTFSGLCMNQFSSAIACHFLSVRRFDENSQQYGRIWALTDPLLEELSDNNIEAKSLFWINYPTTGYH